MGTDRNFASMLNQRPAVQLPKMQRPHALQLPKTHFNQNIKQSIWARLAQLGGK